MNAIIDVHSRKILNWSISNSNGQRVVHRNYWRTPLPNYGAPEYTLRSGSSIYQWPIHRCAQRITSKYQWMAREGPLETTFYIERFWKSIKYEKDI